MGVRTEEAETSDDFRRVRELADWPRLRDEMQGVAVKSQTAKAVTPAAVSPPPPKAAAAPTGSASPPSPAAATATGSAGLAIPSALAVPTALSYDAVSRRFVVADTTSDALKVIDELAGNAVDLVSPQWAAPYRPTALAIDARRGDLWVAGVDEAGGAPRSMIYKLQLVSGRMLQKVELPKQAGAARLVDITIGRNTIYFLDAHGRRVFSLPAESGSPRVYMPTYGAGTPVSLTLADDSTIYVSYATGLARLDLTTRTSLPIPAAGKIDLANVFSLAWGDQVLLGVQKSGDSRHVAVRIRLDKSGRSAIERREIGPAQAAAAEVVDGMFCYVAEGPNGPVLRKASLR
jgi:hypothetical protein